MTDTNDTSQSLPMTPIGVIESCFTDKFGVPRQPGLAPSASGSIRLFSPWDQPDAFRGMEAFSHLWITFVFHLTPQRPFQPLIRPPRLGGNARTGVFASRSPFRPNRLGLSVVRFQGLEKLSDGLRVHISDLDLVDGTPVLDIKPWLPWSDVPADGRADWAGNAPEPVPVQFSDDANASLHQWVAHYPSLPELIRELLSQDPRPGYRRGQQENRIYCMRLHNIDVHWQYGSSGITVVKLADASQGSA